MSHRKPLAHLAPLTRATAFRFTGAAIGFAIGFAPWLGIGGAADSLRAEESAQQINARLTKAVEAKQWELVEKLAPELIARARVSLSSKGQRAAHYLAASSLADAANAYRVAGRLSQALTVAKRAQTYWEGSGRDAQLLPRIATALGRVYEAQENYREAARMYRWAQITREQTDGVNSTKVADPLRKRGDVYLKEKRYSEAEELYLRALRIEEKAHGMRHKYTAWVVEDLGDLYKAQDKTDKAVAHYLRALSIYQQEYGADSSRVAHLATDLADVYSEAGKVQEAERNYRRAIQIWEKTDGADSLKLTVALNNFANLIDSDSSRQDEAEQLHLRALRIKRAAAQPDNASISISLNNLAWLAQRRHRYPESEEYFQQSLALRRQALAPADGEVIAAVRRLADLYEDWGKYAKAEQLFQEALELQEQAEGKFSTEAAAALKRLAFIKYRLGKHDDALRLQRRAQVIYEQQEDAEESDRLAGCLHDQGLTLLALEQYRDAERLLQRSLELKRRGAAGDDVAAAPTLDALGDLHSARGQYPQAEALYLQAIKLAEGVSLDNPSLSFYLSSYGEMLQKTGRYAEAAKALERAFALREKSLGSEHPLLAGLINSLAFVYYRQSRYGESKSLAQRAKRIVESSLGAENATYAGALNTLAVVYKGEGDYAQAEILLKHMLAISRRVGGEQNGSVSAAYNNLGSLYSSQDREQEAIDFYRRALAITRSLSGTDNAAYARTLNNIGDSQAALKRYAEAIATLEESLTIRRRIFDQENTDIASSYSSLASVHLKQDRLDKAEELYQAGLEIAERVHGADHVSTTSFIMGLARVRRRQTRLAEAEELVDRSLAIEERANASPASRFGCYQMRAELAWEAGRRSEAVADLRKAIELAETVRHKSSGTERERAATFSSYADAFELMVQWQAELGNLSEALLFMERARARSLLDEFALSGSDTTVGMSLVERERALAQETAIRKRIAAAQTKLQELRAAGRSGTVGETPRAQEDLANAQADLYRHYSDSRSSSTVYRSLLSAGSGPPRLSQLRRDVLGDEGLLLVYFVGESATRLLMVSGADAELFELAAEAEDASTLQIEAGAASAASLGAAMARQDRTGVVDLLSKPEGAPELDARLAALARVILPAKVRSLLLAGEMKRLIIVPDGALSLLPFEALRVARRAEGKLEYLLDVAPPIQYSPSVTVLYNLARRRGEEGEINVLSLADPDYLPSQPAGERLDGGLAAATPGSRYGAAGGRLPKLPFSGVESNWISAVFKETGLPIEQLIGRQATESNLRKRAANCRIVHLACHGLADQEHGNFFGALALSPPASGELDPLNDGFLTTSEIHMLPLKSAELTILSACETNYGPQQKGEGVWAISRGFLVAGSRRVVASNWLVDDEAAASLMSFFCGGIANYIKHERTPDYALALHEAKKWARRQEKWKSPYYWSSFVLVGPN